MTSQDWLSLYCHILLNECLRGLLLFLYSIVIVFNAGMFSWKFSCSRTMISLQSFPSHSGGQIKLNFSTNSQRRERAQLNTLPLLMLNNALQPLGAEIFDFYFFNSITPCPLRFYQLHTDSIILRGEFIAFLLTEWLWLMTLHLHKCISAFSVLANTRGLPPSHAAGCQMNAQGR